MGQACLPHMGEDKWVTTWNTRPNYKIMPADWEGSVRSEEAVEEASAKDEAMILDEFMRRLEFNKASGIDKHDFQFWIMYMLLESVILTHCQI